MRYLTVCVVLLLIAEYSSAQCPKQCQCDAESRVVCRTGNLTDLPDGKLNAQTQHLDVSGNKIDILRRDTFFKRDLLEITHLNLSSNHISNIEEDAFKWLRHLKVLDLSGNNIGIIQPEVLNDCEYLEVLLLNDNPILQIPDLGFNLPHLFKLGLIGCNLHTIPDGFWTDMKNIEYLELSNNNLSHLSQTKQLAHLKFLDLKNNSFDNFDDELLRLSVHISVDVSDNPWFCSCDLFQGFELYQQRDYRPVLVCQFPTELNGAAISSSLLEQFECENVEISTGIWILIGVIILVVSFFIIGGIIFLVGLFKCKLSDRSI